MRSKFSSNLEENSAFEVILAELFDMLMVARNRQSDRRNQEGESRAQIPRNRARNTEEAKCVAK